MTHTSLIRVERLWRYYGVTCAVKDVSFEVERGVVLGFLGPNGAGKTTTMQVLSGNLAPTAGRVWINGVDILDQPKQAKGEIGYLPEHPPVHRELTVDEYLRYCGRLHGLRGTGLKAALDKAKQRCGLAHMSKRLIGNLSKGYQQRTGIAQAIIHSPAVVILDEPTVGLDPIQIREIRSLIRELSGEHSVILSTHILPEIQATCDEVQIIHKGELVLRDTIDGLVRRMQASSVRLGLRRPPAVELLQGVAGVTGVESLADGVMLLHHEPYNSPAEALAKLAAEQDWGLYELSPERVSLEQIFVDITRTEPIAQPIDSAAAAA